MNYLIFVFENSLFYKGFTKLRTFFILSYLYRYSCLVGEVVVTSYRHSYTHTYLHSNHSFFTPLFSDGFFTSFVPRLFDFTDWFMHICQNLWEKTLTHKIWTHIQFDCKKNKFSSLATLLFSSLIFYSLLTLLVGKGFTRSQMLVMLGIIFLLFGLSQIKGDSEYLANSVIIKWLQKIYL